MIINEKVFIELCISGGSSVCAQLSTTSYNHPHFLMIGFFPSVAESLLSVIA
jgi:hypothetical protein